MEVEMCLMNGPWRTGENCPVVGVGGSSAIVLPYTKSSSQSKTEISRKRWMSTNNAVMCAESSYSSVCCLSKWRNGAFDSDMTWHGLDSEDESSEQWSCSAIEDTPNPEPLKNIALNNFAQGHSLQSP